MSLPEHALLLSRSSQQTSPGAGINARLKILTDHDVLGVAELPRRVTRTAPRPPVKATRLDTGNARYISPDAVAVGQARCCCIPVQFPFRYDPPRALLSIASYNSSTLK